MSSRDRTEEPLDTHESSTARSRQQGCSLEKFCLVHTGWRGSSLWFGNCLFLGWSFHPPGLSRSATSMGLRALAMHAYLHKRGHKERKFLSEGVINCRVAKDLQARSNPYDTGNPCTPGCCRPHEPMGPQEPWAAAKQIWADDKT